MRRYLQLLRIRPFAALWAGSTISSIGDAMTWITLIWLVFTISGSPRAVSVLVIVYMAPTLAGGLAMGSLLDRFDRRRTLIVVNAFLGLAVGSVPLLHRLGALHEWHLYAVAGLYGLLKMANWAGVPAIVPSVVPPEDLNTANAMESIGFGVSDVAGPAVAGVLIGAIGGANVLCVDALSYALFEVFLLRLSVPAPAELQPTPVTTASEESRRDLRPAFRFMVRSPAVFAITLMFMAFNVGEGMLFVLLPILVRHVLRGSASEYGLLVSTFAVAALVGSSIVGAVDWRWTLGRSVAAAQALAGMAFLGLLFATRLPTALVGLAVAGLLASPLTIWAQTIRMRLIPPRMRGRVFGVLRTLMQSTPPIGAALARVMLSGGGIRATVWAMGLLMAVRGALGLVIPALADANTRADTSAESAVPAP